MLVLVLYGGAFNYRQKYYSRMDETIVLFLLTLQEAGSVIPPIVPLSSEHLSENGIYFLESGEDGLIYVGKEASSDDLQQIFGVGSVDALPTQVFQNPC